MALEVQSFGEHTLKQLFSEKLVQGAKLKSPSDISFCKACVQGKMHKRPIKRSQTSTSNVLEIVHTDVSDLMKMQSIGGAKYFVTFIDDYSHYTVVYFLKEKSEVFAKFKEFEVEVTNQMGKTILMC